MTSTTRARLPNVRHEQRRHDRLQGIPLRTERHFQRQPGAEAQVGLQHVRLGRKRIHLQEGDARNCQRELTILLMMIGDDDNEGGDGGGVVDDDDDDDDDNDDDDEGGDGGDDDHDGD